MVTEMEGGYRTRLFPTGLAAAAMTLLSYLKPGDHLLIADCVYEPCATAPRDSCFPTALRPNSSLPTAATSRRASGPAPG